MRTMLATVKPRAVRVCLLHCPWDFERIAEITVLQRPEGISAIIKDGKVVDRGTAGGPNKLREALGGSGAFC